MSLHNSSVIFFFFSWKAQALLHTTQDTIEQNQVPWSESSLGVSGPTYIPDLTYLRDGLWPGSARWNIPFPYQIPFGQNKWKAGYIICVRNFNK